MKTSNTKSGCSTRLTLRCTLSAPLQTTEASFRRKYAVGYKVCHFDDVTLCSAIALGFLGRPGQRLAKYALRRWTYRLPKCGPLACFNSLADVRDFMASNWGLGAPVVVEVCYVPSDDTALWYPFLDTLGDIGCQRRDSDIPNGTRFAQRVLPLRVVPAFELYGYVDIGFAGIGAVDAVTAATRLYQAMGLPMTWDAAAPETTSEVAPKE